MATRSRGGVRAPDWSRRLGAALRRARQDAGLRQVDLAAALGVSVSTVRRAEQGRAALRPVVIDAWERTCSAQIRVDVRHASVA